MLNSSHISSLDVVSISTRQPSLIRTTLATFRKDIDLGRSDVYSDLSFLSRHLSMPLQRHLDQAFKIFPYLKCHLNSKLVMNPEHMSLGEVQGPL